jgi:hypothetical protein
VFENRVQRRFFGRKKEGRKELHSIFSSPNIIMITK